MQASECHDFPFYSTVKSVPEKKKSIISGRGQEFTGWIDLYFLRWVYLWSCVYMLADERGSEKTNKKEEARRRSSAPLVARASERIDRNYRRVSSITGPLATRLRVSLCERPNSLPTWYVRIWLMLYTYW